MATPDTRSSLVITKSFLYRGQTRRWSSRYHVTGPETISDSEFVTLADAVVADEIDALDGNVTIVEGSWSDASTATTTNPHGITTHQKDYSSGGNISGTGHERTPGDCAVFIRYSTDARTSKNHPIYLFNYYHGAMYDAGGDYNTVAAAMKTALEEYGDDWVAGFSDGTNTRVRCGPRGAVALSRHVPTYISHRDFPN